MRRKSVKFTFLVVAIWAHTSPAQPADQASDPADICANRTRAAAMLRYKQETFPLSAYLGPTIGGLAAMANGERFETSAGPVTSSPQQNARFSELKEVLARTFELDRKLTEIAKAEAGKTLAEKRANPYRPVQAELTRFRDSPAYRRQISILKSLGVDNFSESFVQALGKGNTVEAHNISSQAKAAAESYIGEVKAEEAARTARARAGRTMVRGAAGAIGANMALGIGNVLVTKWKCGQSLSFDQAERLAKYTEAEIYDGCKVRAKGALKLAQMTDENLKSLCRDIPDLPELLLASVLKEADRNDNFPKPRFIGEPNCKDSTIRAEFDDRTYVYTLKGGTSGQYDVKVNVEKRGSVNMYYTAEFDEKTGRFSKISLTNPTSADGPVTDEVLTGQYASLAEKGKLDYTLNPTRVLGGESLNVGRALIPLMKSCPTDQASDRRTASAANSDH